MKLPFECTILDSEPVEVFNRFGNGSCMLTPKVIAVYDTIMGAELLSQYSTMRKGLDWFRKYYPNEYMILLD